MNKNHIVYGSLGDIPELISDDERNIKGAVVINSNGSSDNPLKFADSRNGVEFISHRKISPVSLFSVSSSLLIYQR